MPEAPHFTFLHEASPDKWSALPKTFKAGEKVYRFLGYDYGCAADDFKYGNVQSIACTLDKEGYGQFFTVPCAWLLDPKGKEPLGPYTRFARSDR